MAVSNGLDGLKDRNISLEGQPKFYQIPFSEEDELEVIRPDRSIFEELDRNIIPISDNIKVLTIGDLHFKTSNTRETEELIDRILRLIDDENPDLIVALGDTLDTHEKIHVGPLTRATEFFRQIMELQKRKERTFVNIIGNHDRPNNSDFMSGWHPFTAMHEWDNTIIADTAKSVIIKGYRFIFVPYVPPGRFDEALISIEEWKYKTTAIFAHQEFYGAKMGAIFSQVGDKWPIDRPLVITGHVHEYQQLQPNLIYVGTPMQHAFGDVDDKTISIFTFSPLSSLSPLSQPSLGSYHERRVNLNLTKRVIVYIHPRDIFSWTPPENKIVKLVVRGTADEIKAIIKYEGSKDLIERGVKIVYKTVKDDSVDKPENPNYRGDLSFINDIKLPYTKLLYNKIKDNKGLETIFHEIFGDPKMGMPIKKLKLKI